MSDTLERVAAITVTLCAVLLALTLAASVVTTFILGAIHDYRTAKRLRRLKGGR